MNLVLRAPWRVITAGRLVVLGLLVLAAAVALWAIPSSEYIFLPDRAHPVAPLVRVAGGRQPNDGGGIYFVDVIVRKASLLERLFGGLHDGAALVPASQVVPHGVSDTKAAQLDQDEMRLSQQNAAAVALSTLGPKVPPKAAGARVAEVEKGFPADGHLRRGDVIVAVDGKTVRSPADVTQVMAGRRLGSRVVFATRRNGHTRTVALRTVAAGHGSKRGIVGVLLDQAGVSFDANGVGGPSAGLAFALEILEQLGRNVDHGHKIAATGEIWPNGSVHPIGGIEQKTIGARNAGVDAFLVPAGQNARDARKYAKGLRIIPVKSFQQALHVLATLPGAG
jgi:PDZ domain-containing protein